MASRSGGAGSAPEPAPTGSRTRERTSADPAIPMACGGSRSCFCLTNGVASNSMSAQPPHGSTRADSSSPTPSTRRGGSSTQQAPRATSRSAWPSEPTQSTRVPANGEPTAVKITTRVKTMAVVKCRRRVKLDLQSLTTGALPVVKNTQGSAEVNPRSRSPANEALLFTGCLRCPTPSPSVRALDTTASDTRPTADRHRG